MNKFDSVWIPLADCFTEKLGLVLPPGTMHQHGHTDSSLLCSDGRWLFVNGNKRAASWDRADFASDAELLLPTGECMTVAEAWERMKPKPARGIKVGDCVKGDRCGDIWLQVGYNQWSAVPRPGHDTARSLCEKATEQALLKTFGRCKIASWPDVLRWMLEEAEHVAG